MDLNKSMMISAAGLRAQSTRMRIISENLANQDSVASNPDADPYRRKLVTFKNELDHATGVSFVTVGEILPDQTPFGSRFDPGHPAADEDGYISTTNVKGMVENMDMRQAQRSYEANINAIETARTMLIRTLDLLR